MESVFFANSPTLIVSAGALAPTLALAFGLAFERLRRARAEKPPQTDRLLRPPGYSLGRKLDDISDSMLDNWLLATVSSVLAVLATNLEASTWGHTGSIWSSIFVGAIALLAAGGAFYFFFRVARLVRQAKSCRLALRGEQVVGQALVDLTDFGYRTFHDVPAGDGWNLDHVAVAHQGVYMIETRARNRCGSRRGHPANEVHVRKNTLYFPTGVNSTAILQADRNAKWLADYLERKTGEKVPVTPLVVLPGWQVIYKEAPICQVEIMNPKYMLGDLQNKPDSLSGPLLESAIAALDERCRDVEF